MLKFAYSPDFILIGLMILIIPLFIWYYRSKIDIIKRFFSDMDHRKLTGGKSARVELLRFALFFLAGVLMIVALMRPQVGTKVETVKQTGIDVFFLLDVSNSMAAEDLKPSRLEKAKNDIEILLKKMSGDRIGMVVFAGQSYLQFPLTLDHSIGRLILGTIDITTVPQQGTDIAGAMKMATEGFGSSRNAGKAVVIFSDGEDHERGAEEAVQTAAGEGIRVFTVAVGSPAGAKIPIYAGDVVAGYKTDNEGNEVVTKVNEEKLKKLASLGGGQFFRSDDNSEYLVKLYDDISNIEKSEFGAFKVVEYDEVFHWFLVPAVLLLLAGMFVRDDMKWFSAVKERVDEN